MRAFEFYPWAHGLLYDADVVAGEASYTSTLSCWYGKPLHVGGAGNVTFFGYVHDEAGCCELTTERDDGTVYRVPLRAGMYFSAPREFRVRGGAGIAVARWGQRGTFMVGGPAEDLGRLRYIDGCTDSLLIPPTMKGDACLNLLHFPAGVDQTEHTHPSDRIGIIASGRGRCAFRDEEGPGVVELEPGMIFVIKAGGHHKFATPHGSPMRVIAYHPDSDYGPTHQDHPMLNRTIIDGVSAADVRRLQYRTPE